ncbi:MAG: hypothetical protein R8M46_05930 [Ghiorsea sp.]
MNDIKKHKETERFYKISYFIIPIPMIAGAIFAVYVLLTEDSRTTSYCTTASHVEAYQNNPLQDQDFVNRDEMQLDICKDNDDLIDDGDGRLEGKVRWFTCKGTSCGPGWDTILVKK